MTLLNEASLNKHLLEQGLPSASVLRAPELVDRDTGDALITGETPSASGSTPAWVIAISVVTPVIICVPLAVFAYCRVGSVQLSHLWKKESDSGFASFEKREKYSADAVHEISAAPNIPVMGAHMPWVVAGLDLNSDDSDSEACMSLRGAPCATPVTATASDSDSPDSHAAFDHLYTPGKETGKHSRECEGITFDHVMVPGKGTHEGIYESAETLGHVIASGGKSMDRGGSGSGTTGKHMRVPEKDMDNLETSDHVIVPRKEHDQESHEHAQTSGHVIASGKEMGAEAVKFRRRQFNILKKSTYHGSNGFASVSELVFDHSTIPDKGSPASGVVFHDLIEPGKNPYEDVHKDMGEDMHESSRQEDTCQDTHKDTYKDAYKDTYKDTRKGRSKGRRKAKHQDIQDMHQDIDAGTAQDTENIMIEMSDIVASV